MTTTYSGKNTVRKRSAAVTEAGKENFLLGRIKYLHANSAQLRREVDQLHKTANSAERIVLDGLDLTLAAAWANLDSAIQQFELYQEYTKQRRLADKWAAVKAAAGMLF